MFTRAQGSVGVPGACSGWYLFDLEGWLSSDVFLSVQAFDLEGHLSLDVFLSEGCGYGTIFYFAEQVLFFFLQAGRISLPCTRKILMTCILGLEATERNMPRLSVAMKDILLQLTGSLVAREKRRMLQSSDLVFRY